MSDRFLSPVTWLLGFALVLLPQLVAAPGAGTLPELQHQLAAKLDATRLPGSSWGIKVVSLGTGKTLFATNATKLFVPASNTKLFTTALALNRLGADHRLATTLRTQNAPDADGSLKGDLMVVGGGDPTFTARLHGGKWEAALAPLVNAVKAAGIRRINGDLVCDESAFRGAPYGSGWNWDDLGEKYAPAVSALSFNDNTFRVVVTPGPTAGRPVLAQVLPAFTGISNPPNGQPLVGLRNHAVTGLATNAPALRLARLPGGVDVDIDGELPAGGERATEELSIPSPAHYFGGALRQVLAEAGVKLSGEVRVLDWRARADAHADDAAWRDLATVPSPAMAELVRETLKPSQNLYAQLLLLAVGAETERYPRDTELAWPRTITTEAAGLRALGTLLDEAGIAKGEAMFLEGSGMARGNLVTPAALVRLLAFMNQHHWAKAWREALPIGGVDGTLQTRLTGPLTKGNVRAKTGTLRGVSALSGYLTTASREAIAFSIIVNNFSPGGAAQARAETDTLVELLAAFAGRGE